MKECTDGGGGEGTLWRRRHGLRTYRLGGFISLQPKLPETKAPMKSVKKKPVAKLGPSIFENRINRSDACVFDVFTIQPVVTALALSGHCSRTIYMMCVCVYMYTHINIYIYIYTDDNMCIYRIYICTYTVQE